MRKRNNQQWLEECPHHIIVKDIDPDSIDWCLENIEPRNWYLEERVGGIGINLQSKKIITKNIFAFRNSNEAMMFKLMWWKPSNID